MIEMSNKKACVQTYETFLRQKSQRQHSQAFIKFFSVLSSGGTFFSLSTKYKKEFRVHSFPGAFEKKVEHNFFCLVIFSDSEPVQHCAKLFLTSVLEWSFLSRGQITFNENSAESKLRKKTFEGKKLY